MGKADGKPRGKMTAYAFFVQTCREEHKKKNPGESIVFADFSRKCSEKWKVGISSTFSFSFILKLVFHAKNVFYLSFILL